LDKLFQKTHLIFQRCHFNHLNMKLR
jgi:hypothetical protein